MAAAGNGMLLPSWERMQVTIGAACITAEHELERYLCLRCKDLINDAA
jgi:hypothetical protein